MADLTIAEGFEYFKAKENAFIANVESGTTATRAYEKGGYFWKGGRLYKVTAKIAVGDTFTVGTNCELTVLTDGIKDIKLDGYHPDLAAGSAEQIIGNSSVTDMVPYSYRKTGGDLTVGKRAEDTLVGGTVVWNQLLYNNSTVSLSKDSQRTATLSTGGISSIKNHVYYATANIINNTTAQGLYFEFGRSDLTFGSGVGEKSKIYKADKDVGNPSIYTFISSADTSGSTLTYADFAMYDLTQMFGTTIADYIYNLEQTTAGAGVAFFRKLFPNDYYAYNAGELMSVKAVSHDTVGFNLWDGTKEDGKWLDQTDGTVATQSNYSVTDYIKIAPNTSYYKSHSGSGRALYYDANKNALPSQQWNDISSNAYVFTSPANAHYIRFTIASNYQNFIINISDPAKNGTYEPGQKHSYPLDSSLELRGIPKLDSNNKLYYDGDTYASDGTVTRKYGIVDLGTLTWNQDTTTRPADGATIHAFFAVLESAKQINSSTGIANMILNGYKVATVAIVDRAGHDTIQDLLVGGADQNRRIWIYNSAYNDYDTASFKAAMSGVYLVYELETPATETAASYQNPQVVDPNGTEEYVDGGVAAGTRDVSVPVGHETKYYTDLVSKIEGLPSDFSTLIATTEKTTTASRAYLVNEFLIMGNQLYIVTANIASGGTITVGTNVSATTLGAQITALLNA